MKKKIVEKQSNDNNGIGAKKRAREREKAMQNKECQATINGFTFGCGAHVSYTSFRVHCATRTYYLPVFLASCCVFFSFAVCRQIRLCAYAMENVLRNFRPTTMPPFFFRFVCVCLRVSAHRWKLFEFLCVCVRVFRLLRFFISVFLPPFNLLFVRLIPIGTGTHNTKSVSVFGFNPKRAFPVPSKIHFDHLNWLLGR